MLKLRLFFVGATLGLMLCSCKHPCQIDALGGDCYLARCEEEGREWSCVEETWQHLKQCEEEMGIPKQATREGQSLQRSYDCVVARERAKQERLERAKEYERAERKRAERAKRERAERERIEQEKRAVIEASTSAQGYAQGYAQLGEVYLKHGKYPNAAYAFQESLSYSQIASTYISLGRAFYKLKQYFDALKAWDKARMLGHGKDKAKAKRYIKMVENESLTQKDCENETGVRGKGCVKESRIKWERAERERVERVERAKRERVEWAERVKRKRAEELKRCEKEMGIRGEACLKAREQKREQARQRERENWARENRKYIELCRCWHEQFSYGYGIEFSARKCGADNVGYLYVICKEVKRRGYD